MARRTAKKARAKPARRAPGVHIGEVPARAMVLHGSAQVFAKVGVRAASVEDLLAASGVSRRTFYRLYAGKEAVVLALYTFGTEMLLDACRRAAASEHDLQALVERCIDAHLDNARDHGRLVFVLGGEAQHQESALHARRLQVHDEIVDLMAASWASRRSGGVDRLLLRGLLLALEGVTRRVLAEADEGREVDEAGLAHARRVMLRIASGAVSANETAGGR